MQVSVKWLRQWIDIGDDIPALADRLTEAGLEVGNVQRLRLLPKTIVVGEIVALEQHKSYSKISICKVDVGRKRLCSIVCGASNVSVGVKAPIALPGTVLPDGRKIGQKRLYDIVSSGMICSGEEIGIEDDCDGIYQLDARAGVGQNINQYLELDDSILELDLTPNRGDCLSVIGLAREIASFGGGTIRSPRFTSRSMAIDSTVAVSVSAPLAAPRYVGRLIEDIDQNIKTPDWMKERLRRSGLRTLGPVVDITNFVMLELGQPLHAFDLQAIKGHIEVRLAKPREKLMLLDGTRLQLCAKTLVIADSERPIGLAGIMGGANSAVTAKTNTIFLESAFFSPKTIAHGARTYNLQTDASYRFERGVDPTQQRRAVLRASQLLGEICGGRPGEILERKDNSHLPVRKKIILRKRRLEKILGSTIKPKEVDKALTSLNMSPVKVGQGWQIRPPHYRFDIIGEHDLIEEVARVSGFGRIPNNMPIRSRSNLRTREEILPVSRIEDYLVDHDYSEVITYSFVHSTLQKYIDPGLEMVYLKNPIASTMDVMRTSLLTGILTAVNINRRRQAQRVRLFETGKVFHRESGQIVETNHVGGAVCGPVDPLSWQSPERAVDFFDIKGHVEGLLNLGATDRNYEFRPANDPALHPGQSAAIWNGKSRIGRIGLLHPELQRKFDFDFDLYVFDLILDSVTCRSIPIYASISRFPSVSRDISLVIDKKYSAEAVAKIIRGAGGHLLRRSILFDVYSGQEIKNNCKSLSFSLTLQSSSSNLTDTDVESVLNSIVTAVNKVGGELRTAK
ncbi:MAG: phenylalanine--tRNA ligase subunit beta [Acidiferrobacteraceae bacterium]|nr:phenylalanine--tRNA ligase subunit beta [Acidiferrobacteraceae bacterium]